SAEVIARGIANDVTRDALRGVGPLLRASSAAMAAEQDRNFRIERTDRATRTLPLGPNGSLELKNISGEVQVAVDLRGERGSADITYPRGDMPYRVNATYTVTAPAGTRITARSISGN